jgi:hypothetical protein
MTSLNEAYVIEEPVIQPKQEELTQTQPILDTGKTPLNILSEDSIQITEICNTKIAQKDQTINQLNKLNSQLNQDKLSLQSEINNLEAKRKKDRTEKPVLEQQCKINNKNKWFVTIGLAILILLFTSTYTINLVDTWLDNHSVDLFSRSDRMNELLLLIIQFIIIIIIIRLVLQFA